MKTFKNKRKINNPPSPPKTIKSFTSLSFEDIFYEKSEDVPYERKPNSPDDLKPSMENYHNQKV